jgi:RNA polymerase sigma-70 factor (ECF subfamily)
LTLRRTRGRRRRHEGPGGETVAGAQVAQRHAAPPGLSLDLEQMLECLDEEDRALVILKYAENYSYEELAEIFGLSVSACKMRVSRARQRIQEKFGESA